MNKELKLVHVSQLKPYAENPRHNNESAKIVAKSIKAYGYINPIVVDENYTILAGNTRFKALKLLGVTEIEVLVVYGLTEDQKKGFVIIDNRAGEYSKWNMTGLDRLVSSVEDSNEKDILSEFEIKNIEEVKHKIEEMIYGIHAPKNVNPEW